MKTKCFQQTVFGIRKSCIGEKCALWVVLFIQDKDGKPQQTPMCTYKANCIASLDTANAIARLKKQE